MMRKARVSGGKGVGTLYRVAGQAKGLRKMSGTSAASSADTAHSFSEEETHAFADWINYALVDDADLKSMLPIDTDSSEGAETLFTKVSLCSDWRHWCCPPSRPRRFAPFVRPWSSL
jgi:hypothetical protein